MIKVNDYTARAKEAYSNAIRAINKNDVAGYARNKSILEEMVRDHCITKEYVKDLVGTAKSLGFKYCA